MPNRELYSNFAVSQLIDPATLSGNGDATNSSEADLQGYDSVMLIANVGESGDSLSGSIKFEFEVEHADDDGAGSPDSWSDVSDSDLANVVSGSNDGCFAVVDAAAEDDAVYYTSYIGEKRYVRVVVNRTGNNANGTPISVTAVRGHPSLAPV